MISFKAMAYLGLGVSIAPCLLLLTPQIRKASSRIQTTGSRREALIQVANFYLADRCYSLQTGKDAVPVIGSVIETPRDTLCYVFNDTFYYPVLSPEGVVKISEVFSRTEVKNQISNLSEPSS